MYTFNVIIVFVNVEQNASPRSLQEKLRKLSTKLNLTKKISSRSRHLDKRCLNNLVDLENFYKVESLAF